MTKTELTPDAIAAREVAEKASWRELAGSEMGECVNPLYSTGFEAGWDAAIAYANKSNGWIAVEAGLPELDNEYLVVTDDQIVVSAWLEASGEWADYGNLFTDGRVVAYRPMLEPYSPPEDSLKDAKP